MRMILDVRRANQYFRRRPVAPTVTSEGFSNVGYKRARDIAAPAHLGALVAAKPRIQAIIQDGVTAGLLPKHPGKSLGRSH